MPTPPKTRRRALVPALAGRVGDEPPADAGAQQRRRASSAATEVAATAAIAFTGGKGRAVAVRAEMCLHAAYTSPRP